MVNVENSVSERLAPVDNTLNRRVDRPIFADLRSAGLRTAMIIASLLASASELSAQNPGDRQKQDEVEKVEPPTIVADWIKRSHADTENRVAELVRLLNDNKFAVREKASNDLMALLRDLQQNISPPPITLQKYIGRQVQGERISAEQRRRLESIDQSLDVENQPSRIPPIRTDGLSLLAQLSKQSGSRVSVDPEDAALSKTIAGHMILVNRERNSFWELVEMVANKAGANIVLQENGDVLISKKGQPLKLVGVEGTVGVFLRKPEKQGAAPTLMLAGEPARSAIVNVREASIDGGPPVNPVDLKLWSSLEGRKAAYGGADMGRPFSAMTLTRDKPVPINGKETTFAIRATEAMYPSETTLSFDDPQARSATRYDHSISINECKKADDGTCTVTFNHGVFTQAPWPATPWEWDRGTYGMAMLTHCEFLDAKGVPIAGTLQKMQFEQRNMNSEWKCKERPATVRIRFYSSVNERMIRARVPTSELPQPPAAPKGPNS